MNRAGGLLVQNSGFIRLPWGRPRETGHYLDNTFRLPAHLPGVPFAAGYPVPPFEPDTPFQLEEQPSEHESQHRTTLGSPISGRGNPQGDAPDIPSLTKRFPAVSNRPPFSRLFARQEILGTSRGDRSAGRGFLKRVPGWDEVNRP